MHTWSPKWKVSAGKWREWKAHATPCRHPKRCGTLLTDRYSTSYDHYRIVICNLQSLDTEGAKVCVLSDGWPGNLDKKLYIWPSSKSHPRSAWQSPTSHMFPQLTRAELKKSEVVGVKDRLDVGGCLFVGGVWSCVWESNNVKPQPFLHCYHLILQISHRQIPHIITTVQSSFTMCSPLPPKVNRPVYLPVTSE
jgi:hypothetical protein